MIFIVGNLMILILGLVLTYISSQLLVGSVLPAILRSKHARRFKQRVSFYMRRFFFFDMLRDAVAHMVTHCESDGNEPFQPYLNSPLRTCPPCEFVAIPAKEEVLEEANNYRFLPAARSARGRRGRARPALRRVIIPAIRFPSAHDPPPSPPPPIIALLLQAADLCRQVAALYRQWGDLYRQVAALYRQGGDLCLQVAALYREDALYPEIEALVQHAEALEQQAADLYGQAAALYRQCGDLCLQVAALYGEDALYPEIEALVQNAEALEQQAKQLRLRHGLNREQ